MRRSNFGNAPVRIAVELWSRPAMFSPNSLTAWCRANRSCRPVSPIRRRNVLAVESLEDRCVPALLTFTPNVFTDPTVNQSDSAFSLREALLKADSAVYARNDALVSLSSGRYELELEGGGSTLGDLDIEPLGRAISIVGAGPGLTFIDANQLDRVFDLFGSGAVIFQNLTVARQRRTRSDDQAATNQRGNRRWRRQGDRLALLLIH